MRYSINSQGVRDDEDSLDEPEVIVAGDSYSMGWSVRQEETYASVLERMTGWKVLNTGISSYGTAREMELLRQVDRSRLRYLILQYCANDFAENQAYIDGGGRLPQRPPEWYESQLNWYRGFKRYYPGKYSFFVVEGALDSMYRMVRVSHPARAKPRREIEVLGQVIESSPVDFTQVTLIIFEINGRSIGRTWTPTCSQSCTGRSPNGFRGSPASGNPVEIRESFQRRDATGGIGSA